MLDDFYWWGFFFFLGFGGEVLVIGIKVWRRGQVVKDQI